MMNWQWDSGTQVRSYELPSGKGILTISSKIDEGVQTWYLCHDEAPVATSQNLLQLMNIGEEYGNKFGLIPDI